MPYISFGVPEVTGVDRVPLLTVNDEVAVRVHHHAVGIWIEVFLTSHSRVLAAGGYRGHVLL